MTAYKCPLVCDLLSYPRTSKHEASEQSQVHFEQELRRQRPGRWQILSYIRNRALENCKGDELCDSRAVNICAWQNVKIHMSWQVLVLRKHKCQELPSESPDEALLGTVWGFWENYNISAFNRFSFTKAVYHLSFSCGNFRPISIFLKTINIGIRDSFIAYANLPLIYTF